MGNNDKSSDSSSNQRPRTKPNRKQSWAQLTAKYLHDLPQQLDGMRAILELKDYRKIKSRAHRIKGTSGTYRLDTISESVAQLEHLADSQNPDTIATAINKVMRLVELETKRLNSQAAASTSSSERNTNG